MESVWFKHYEQGVPTTINPDQYSSLVEVFRKSFKQYKDLPAFTNMGVTLTYDKLEQQATYFAGFLQKKLGLKRGDRVAIMLPNTLQYPIVMIGALMAGCTVVNVNPLYTPDELLHQMHDAEPKVIVVLENFAHTVLEGLTARPEQVVIVTKIGDVLPKAKGWLANFVVKKVKHLVPQWHFNEFYWYKDVMRAGKKAGFAPPHIEGSDIAFLQYTGGTTGRAKGAMLTHRNMVANMLQAAAWLKNLLRPRQEIIITAIPLYHIFSLTANCLIFMYFGGLNVLITNPKDTKDFIKQMKKHKFTAITGVNTLFNLLLNQPRIKTVDFSRLKIALGGGMAIQPSVAQRWQQLTSRPLIEAYGLTETSPAVCINPMTLKQYNGFIGLPIPSTEICVRNNQGDELGFDEAGELCVRGPQVMRGYWQQSEETAAVLDQDGWLHTGDIAVINKDGYVKLVDRKKDMILVSGFNVYPNEIEEVISAIPGVQEVGVVGVPDLEHGELVKAVIVRRDQKLTEDQIIAYCQEHLTGYKIPKIIEFRDTLPKSNIGKILRKELR